MTLPDFKGQFMPTMIPAAPGTNIIEAAAKDDTFFRTPVIAWAPDAENPYRAPHPITVDGLTRLVGCRAVEFAGGLIHDRSSAIPFTNVQEWLVYIKSDKSNAGRPKPADMSSDEDDDLMGTLPPEVPDEAPVRASAPAGDVLIEWTTKPYKTNSFYRYTDDSRDFVFQVESGLNPPKQKGAVTKIKRDEFMQLKKTMDVVEVDSLMAGHLPEGVEGMDRDEEEEDLI